VEQHLHRGRRRVDAVVRVTEQAHQHGARPIAIPSVLPRLRIRPLPMEWATRPTNPVAAAPKALTKNGTQRRRASASLRKSGDTAYSLIARSRARRPLLLLTLLTTISSHTGDDSKQ